MEEPSASLEDQVSYARDVVEAMKLRLKLKRDELDGLRDELALKRNKLSLQIHSIKSNEK